METGILDIYEEHRKAEQRRRVEIGGAVSPIYSYRQTSGSSMMAAASSSSSYSEKGLISTGGGFNVNVGLGKTGVLSQAYCMPEWVRRLAPELMIAWSMECHIRIMAMQT